MFFCLILLLGELKIMGKNLPAIKAIAFDYGGVLAYFIRKEEIAEMAKLARVDFDKFNLSLWKHRDKLDSGEFTSIQYYNNVLEICSSPVSPESIVETLIEMDLKGFSKINKNMLLWANALKNSGLKTAIISNMAEETYHSLVKNQNWIRHFDSITISGIIGINKPDYRIFDYAIKQIGVEAEEILFIDDMPINIESAQKAGLQALLFKDTKKLEKDIKKHYPYLPIKGLN